MNARPSDVLVIEHGADCPPGLLSEVLAAAGLTMHLRRPYRGDQLPADLGTFEGLVVLGGQMGARDDAECPWLPETRRLLALAVDRHLPTLGICLGAQLAAVALEGRTGPREEPLVGAQAVTLTAAGCEDPVLGALEGEQPPMISWNRDTVTQLPPHSTLLAQDAGGGIAAFRTGTALWAVQFHPEIVPAVLESWAASSSLTPPGTRPGAMSQLLAEDPGIYARGAALLDAFARQVLTD